MAIDDVWYEILVRVDPSWIFNCILVCKGWLEEITGPEFRRRYQHKVVGFIKQYSRFELFATTELGRITKADDSKIPYDYFVSKSGEGDGLILYGSLEQNILYVSKPGEKKPIQLPRIQRGMYGMNIAILSHHNSYKVILIQKNYNDYHCVDIHTFSPQTTRWTKSPMIRYHKYMTSRKPGIVSSSRGLVYWPHQVGGVSVYDDNNEQEPVGWIDGPPNPPDMDNYKPWLKVNYGMSPQGYLQCAISTFGSGPTIYSLFDDDDGGNKVWNKLYCVETSGFSFVSFVPGRSDCIFVTTKSFHGGIPCCQLSLYNLHTSELATYSCKSDSRWRAYDNYIDLAPLTMADLGVWPSSPFSDTTRLLSDIYGIKNTMDSTSPLLSRRRKKSYSAFFVSAVERYADYTWLDYI